MQKSKNQVPNNGDKNLIAIVYVCIDTHKHNNNQQENNIASNIFSRGEFRSNL